MRFLCMPVCWLLPAAAATRFTVSRPRSHQTLVMDAAQGRVVHDSSCARVSLGMNVTASLRPGAKAASRTMRELVAWPRQATITELVPTRSAQRPRVAGKRPAR